MEKQGSIVTGIIWGTVIGLALWMSFLGWMDILFGK